MADLIGGSTEGNPKGSNGDNPQTQAPATVDWRASLPDDLKSEPSLQNIKEIGDLAKSYVHAQKMVGKDKIVVPDQFATPEDWRKNVFSKLGLPESEDKYEIKVKEGSKLDPEFLKGLKAEAFKHGILPNQAAKLAEFYDNKLVEFETKYNETMKTQTQANVDSLKKEWGAGFDKNLKIANEVLNKFADKDMMEYIKSSGMANDTKLVKLLYNMGAKVLDDKVLGEAATGSGKTPAEAKLEIDRIMGDTNHPYFNNQHPSHGAAIEEVNKLYSYMYAENN